MSEKTKSKDTYAKIIIAYPFATLLVGVGINLTVGVQPMTIALPGQHVMVAAIIAAALLLFNHSWLMTTTELTRLKYGLHATPEEWEESGIRREDAPDEAWRELERRHAAHRNVTENTVYFVFLAGLFSLTTPSAILAYLWLPGFALARLGHSYCFLVGRDGWRGVFMSISLVTMFGLLTHLGISAIR